MTGFMLLIWISLIVILNVRGEGVVNDNSSICEYCNDKSLPDCSTLDNTSENVTKSCQYEDLSPCIITVFEGKGTDHMCLLNKHVNITQDTIEMNKSSNLVEKETITEWPIKNAADEESKFVKSISENITSMEEMNISNIQEATIKSFEEQIEALKKDSVGDVIVKEVEAQHETAVEAENEPSSTVKADEMPQADQTISENETNVKKANEIEDNKIETSTAAEETHEVMSKKDEHNEGSSHVEPRMNSVEITAVAETEVKTQNCFVCVSTNEPNCVTKPTNEIACKMLGKNNTGCFTLLKVDTKITTRGCISDLMDEGVSYCKAHKNFCVFCYEQGCNNLTAPSGANQLKSANFIFILVGIYYGLKKNG